MHADDIRSLASGQDSLERQIDLVKCISKCEIVSFGKSVDRGRKGNAWGFGGGMT